MLILAVLVAGLATSMALETELKCHKCVQAGSGICNNQNCLEGSTADNCDCPDGYTTDENACAESCGAQIQSCFKCNTATSVCESTVTSCSNDIPALPNCECQPGYQTTLQACEDVCGAQLITCFSCNPSASRCVSRQTFSANCDPGEFLDSNECADACVPVEIECFKCQPVTGDCDSEMRSCPAGTPEADCLCTDGLTKNRAACDAGCQRQIDCTRCLTELGTCEFRGIVCPANPNEACECPAGFNQVDQVTCDQTCPKDKDCFGCDRTIGQCVKQELQCPLDNDDCTCQDIDPTLEETETDCTDRQCAPDQIIDCYKCDKATSECNFVSSGPCFTGPGEACHECNDDETIDPNCDGQCREDDCFVCDESAEACVNQPVRCDANGCDACAGSGTRSGCEDECLRTLTCFTCDNNEANPTCIEETTQCPISPNGCSCASNGLQSTEQQCLETCFTEPCHKCDNGECVNEPVVCTPLNPEECTCVDGFGADDTCEDSCVREITCFECNNEPDDPKCLAVTRECTNAACDCSTFGLNVNAEMCVAAQQCAPVQKDCYRCWRAKEECTNEPVICLPFLGQNCGNLQCPPFTFTTKALCETNCEREPKEDPKRIFGAYGYPHHAQGAYSAIGHSASVLNFDRDFGPNGVGVGFQRLQRELARTKFSHIQRSEHCQMPFSEGWGDKSEIRYYYDPQFKLCKAFTYRGDGGNMNRFRTKNACDAACGFLLFEEFAQRHPVYEKFDNPLH